MKSPKALTFFLLVLFAEGFQTVSAQLVFVQSPYIAVVADPSIQDMVIGTSYGTTPTYASLLYGFVNGAYDIFSSHIIFNIDGTPFDLQTPYTIGTAMAANGTNLGAYIEGSEVVSNVDLRSHYEIVNNVIMGLQADMIELRYTATNNDTVSHQLGCRVELDTEVDGNDGAIISVDNGASLINANTVWRATTGPVPTDWWGYSSSPTASAVLVGRGSLYDNPNGVSATPPDVLEAANWPDVNGAAQWTIAANGSVTDSAVVIWWTGTGSEHGLNQNLAPGQAITWITYYGINEPSPTPTPTNTSTTTPTLTPTLTPTFTNSTTPTLSFTWTQTFTSTSTPTLTPTQTPTDTPTLTFTPTITYTPTLTFTSTNTFTITQTPTITDTFTVTPTFTPTCAIHLWPDPFNPNTAPGGLLKVSCVPTGGLVGFYTVSGEMVQVAQESGGLAQWGGINRQGVRVSPGIYFYVIQNGSNVLARGKFLINH